MTIMRAVLVGALMWLLIFVTFAIVEFIPVFKSSVDIQAAMVAFLMIPIAIFGASIYYKNDSKESGFLVGMITAFTALVLDALITVPFIELPKGNSYNSFFSYPFLWLLVFLNIATIYIYWRIKIWENS